MKDITKREYFAAMAMQGLLAHHGIYDEGYLRNFSPSDDDLLNVELTEVEGYIPNEYPADDLAKTALVYADAIIKKLADSET